MYVVTMHDVDVIISQTERLDERFKFKGISEEALSERINAGKLESFERSQSVYLGMMLCEAREMWH